MKYAAILILIVFSFQVGWTQKIKEITHREVNVHFNDSFIKANVLLVDKKIHLKNTTDYYWYYNNSIKRNQGDYKGRLLDGKYQVTSLKGHLITKGYFKKGHKTGEWKKWNNQGKLVYINNWVNGNQNGKYQKYENGKLTEQGIYKKNKLQGNYLVYDNGKLIEKRNYKQGMLHGNQITYRADTVFTKTAYKKGKEVTAKEKSNSLAEEKGAEIDEEMEITTDKSTKKWWQIWRKEEKKQEKQEEDLGKKKQLKEKKNTQPRSKKRIEKENKIKKEKNG